MPGKCAECLVVKGLPLALQVSMLLPAAELHLWSNTFVC